MNLKIVFLGLDNGFSPKIIGRINDQYVKIVKVKGQEVPWHNHENEDELFCNRGWVRYGNRENCTPVTYTPPF